jgi:hypothetical protein
MSGHVVIDDHDDLIDVGSLRHAELDKIILEGIIPTIAEGISPPALGQERTVGIPLLPADNGFVGTNTFQTVNIQGDLNVYGTRNEVSVSNLEVENTVILLGYGTAGELPSSDRGILFTAAGPNPSLYWDHTQTEFRLALVDVSPSVTEFPDPDASGHGGYASFRAGSINVSNVTSPTGSFQTLNVDDINISSNINAQAATFAASIVKADQLLVPDGSQSYLSRYVKAGSGVEILEDPLDPGALIASVRRQKESKSPGQFLPSNEVFQSGIVSSSTTLTNESLDVYVNGVLVSMGTNFDYVLDPAGIRFHFALEPDDTITIISY